MARSLPGATPTALICLWSALQGTVGFRLPEQGRSVAVPCGEDNNSADELVVKANQAKVPDIGTFTNIWTKRWGLERGREEPLRSSIKLVLGVMTIPEDENYRNVVRRTWMKKGGVCSLSEHEPSADCSVHVAFVLGRADLSISLEEEERRYKEEERAQPSGLLVLNISETMNGGKTQLWFRTALELAPWATHIGKMDMDTYPILPKLIYRLERSRACKAASSPYEFIGRPACTDHCHFGAACESSGCDDDHSSSQDTVPLGGSWGFLLGQFYVMSRELVHNMDWGVRAPGRPEDVLVSHIAKVSAEKWGFCLRVLRLDAWYHDTPESDAGYINDY